MLLKDWSVDPFTATEQDRTTFGGHPQFSRSEIEASSPWYDRLTFAGTETAVKLGGFLEGALEAADLAVHDLNERLARGAVMR